MVKRYLINYDARGEQEHPSGDFVHWPDYQALERDLAEARAAAERQWEGWIKEEALRKAAEAERDRLAAALREIMKDDQQPSHPCGPQQYGHFGNIARASLQTGEQEG